ncbi:hypothetical protein E7T09_04070 [Deinococcus sp. KSM4-11]|uniref:hypothetical protein n=1 Tax=Deinococcus sp. KSM4-11 TaxID=2568654 RepID=UPI0010A45384|nr:hypothetical protein [Deinococcus sp. KSM4-11]THF88390.1 hypothetical protein E7T09_04070 [Deinococcus sp. KSM4-11]
MDTEELERWQGTLPTNRDDLLVILEQLQADWLEAQTAFTAAVRLGTGEVIQQVVMTLAQQIQIVEQHLIHGDAATGEP